MTFNLEAPQLVWLAMSALGIVMSTAHHGKPRGPHNAGETFLNCVISLSVLYWGGFFS